MVEAETRDGGGTVRRGSGLPENWSLVPLVGFCVGSFTGIAIAQSSLALGAAGLVADAWLRGKEGRRDALRLPEGLAPVIAFYLAVQFLAVIFSQHVPRSYGLLKGDLPILFLPLFLLLLKRTTKHRVVLWTFLVTAGLSGLYGLWQYAFGIDIYRGRPLEALPGGGFLATGVLGGHLTYGGLHLVATLLGMGWVLHGPRGRMRIWALLVTLGCAAGLLASGARTGWVGAGAGCVALVLSLERRKAAAWIGGAAALALGALLLPGLSQRALGFLDLGEMPRVRLWETAVRIWNDFPVIGAGLGSFKTHFPLYKVTGGYLSTIHPHNDILNVAVHSGLAGVLAFSAVWLWILRRLRRVARHEANRRSTAYGAFAAAVGFLVAGLGQCYFTDEEPVSALWFAVALGLCAGGRSLLDDRVGIRKGDGALDEALENLAPVVEGVTSAPSEPAPSRGIDPSGRPAGGGPAEGSSRPPSR